MYCKLHFIIVNIILLTNKNYGTCKNSAIIFICNLHVLLIFERAVRDKTEHVKLDSRLDHHLLLTSMLLDNSSRFFCDPIKNIGIYFYNCFGKTIKKMFYPGRKSSQRSLSSTCMKRYLPSAVLDDDTRAALIVSAHLPTLTALSPVYQTLSSVISQLAWSSRYYLQSPSFSFLVIIPSRRTTVEPVGHRLPVRSTCFFKCRRRCRQFSADLISFQVISLKNVFQIGISFKRL